MMVNEIFNERPKANEKKRALAYIGKLLDDARKDKNKNQSDIVELEEVQRLLNSKRYGLVWEEHAEKVEEEMNTKIPIFVEDKSKKIKDDLDNINYNFILEGDNLHSLHLLEKTHANSIDIIYIDPPYNTGNNDFKYNDTFVGADDEFKHSKWLSFMNSRLTLAKRLLNSEGILFLSIGDDEQAELTMLVDEIFGRQNRLAVIPRIAKRTSDKGNQFRPTKDYVLAYAVDVFKQPEFKILKKFNINDYNKIEKGTGRKYKKSGASLYQPSLDSRPNQRYFIEAPDGSFIIPPGETMPLENKDGAKVLPLKTDGVWRWSEASYQKQKEQLIFTKATNRSPLIDENGNKSKWNIYPKVYADNEDGATKHPEDVIYDFVNSQGTKEVNKLNLSFSFSKPVGLIKYLINIIDKPNTVTVLDFFAGSGTTGQAVTELNAEDGGHRKFILATNNENNIAEEVTYVRMKNVSSGTDKYEAHPMNLKYFKTAFISKDDEDIENELLDNVKTLVELQWGVDLSSSSIRIVTTLTEAGSIELKGLTKVYMRAQVHSMLTQEQVTKYNQTGVTIYDIPESYFSKELREQGL
ncbi:MULTISPECIES: site-specific DNA-methyltransferase [unclassified Leuconostoc]|uniref:site-specific DNA-methyltransferase n=1 Tax=unclassified Leuconostoc TaxID=2685106 RepID=UPI0019059DEB|nr:MULTISPECIES: site-specific DNA-methyltransferase [unclassified Leuconostoc]MBK0040777.1 site-specific DNA-methyltransferase [Leuconostoc sp. S51]MBK0051801.1 site-specific DNA-methyltransferase [Leuconostoc sp. S50]